MKARTLAGIAIRSEDAGEIERAVAAALQLAAVCPDSPEGNRLVAASAHAMGQMARRFGSVDTVLLRKIQASARERRASRAVRTAVDDMWNDIERFIPSLIPGMRPGAEEPFESF